MKCEVLPDSLITLYNDTLKEYREKRQQLCQMQSQLSDSDSEDVDLNESHTALNIMEVHQKLEVLETKLERMENPSLR